VGQGGNGVNKREFETANRRLGDALKRVAPELDWYDDTARAFDGYQCVWNGVASPRSFRSSHIAKSFHTYSWSWDGSIDEAYLLEKIRTGRYQTYGLSDSLLPDLRAREAMAWERLVDEPPPPSALSKSLDWLALPAGMLACVLYIWAMLLAVVIMPFWLIGRGLWKKITHSKS
jgi:hypothetical protein